MHSKKRLYTIIAILIVLLISVGVFLFITHKKAVVEETTASLPKVQLQNVSALQRVSTFSTVGTVEAVSEADLQTEAGGLVTATYAGIGDHVQGGEILATIENNAQSAALQQAEGAYEAAQAGAASSQVSVVSAQNGLQSAKTTGVSTYKNAFITTDSTLHNDIDTIFTRSNNVFIGLEINGRGQATTLVEERNTLESQFVNWSAKLDEASNDTIKPLLESATAYIKTVSGFVDTLSEIVNKDETTDTFDDAAKAALQAQMTADRTALNQTLQSLDGAHNAIVAAEKAVEQAKLAGDEKSNSAASAQIKIAQGALNAAKATYEKTIIRTPITGVVNAFYIKKGDFVSPSSKAVIIANNSGLEIATAVGQDDAVKLHVGDIVAIENASSSGIISAIAPALDPTTGKVALKISVTDNGTLINGSTVNVTFTQKTESALVDAPLTVPIISLKITSSGPVAFGVSSNNTLTSIPVTIGSIEGDTVTITGGLSTSSEIVTDARGLKEGDKVTVE